MDSVHHIWCPLSSQEYQDLPDGAETTLTVDVGDELHEKQAESRLQELRDLLAEGISSGEAKPWNKNAFLRNVRARVANERD
ncbi:TPA: type II toxin-antitoxin system ParD family antitoxin [Klebsiella pneumoniae]